MPKMNEVSIIVDFDVDFFNLETELNDEFFEKIAPILKRADAITIAKEKWHFEDLRKTPGFLHERAITLLLKGLESVMQ